MWRRPAKGGDVGKDLEVRQTGTFNGGIVRVGTRRMRAAEVKGEEAGAR